MDTDASRLSPGSRRRAPAGRSRVLAVSRELFREYGYTGVSMSQIAHASRMTKAALYYHFKDKQDLFINVFKIELERANAELVVVEAAGGTARETLGAIARVILDEGSSDLVRMFDDVKRYVPEHELAARQVSHPLRIVLGSIERGIQRGELRPLDPWTMLKLFHALVLGQVKFTAGLDQVETASRDELVTLLVDVFMHGVAPNPAG